MSATSSNLAHVGICSTIRGQLTDFERSISHPLFLNQLQGVGREDDGKVLGRHSDQGPLKLHPPDPADHQRYRTPKVPSRFPAKCRLSGDHQLGLNDSRGRRTPSSHCLRGVVTALEVCGIHRSPVVEQMKKIACSGYRLGPACRETQSRSRPSTRQGRATPLMRQSVDLPWESGELF
jgi:hypothetical protein